jgi:hypothetical protein
MDNSSPFSTHLLDDDSPKPSDNVINDAYVPITTSNDNNPSLTNQSEVYLDFL